MLITDFFFAFAIHLVFFFFFWLMQISGASRFPYLLYVLTVSGVAYLLKIRNVSAYTSVSVFPVDELLVALLIFMLLLYNYILEERKPSYFVVTLPGLLINIDQISMLVGVGD